MNFYFGLGSFFSKYEKSHKEIMRRVIESKMGVHYCLDYPGSDSFFRQNTSRNERNNTSVIARVPCFNPDVLKNEVDLTLQKLDVENINTLQLWGGEEVFDCYNESSDLYNTLNDLKQQGKVCDFKPQLYYDQTVSLLNSEFNHLKNPSFTFYGSPLGIHISDDLMKNKKLFDCVAMSIFGGVDISVSPKFNSLDEQKHWEFLKENYSWSTICLAYMKSQEFVSHVVGTTRNTKHFSEIENYFDSQIELFDNNIGSSDDNLLDLEKVSLPREKLLVLQKVAAQSCTKEHMAAKDAEEAWTNRHRRLRSKKVYWKSFVYYYISKNKTLYDAVNWIFRRS